MEPTKSRWSAAPRGSGRDVALALPPAPAADGRRGRQPRELAGGGAVARGRPPLPLPDAGPRSRRARLRDGARHRPARGARARRPAAHRRSRRRAGVGRWPRRSGPSSPPRSSRSCSRQRPKPRSTPRRSRRDAAGAVGDQGRRPQRQRRHRTTRARSRAASALSLPGHARGRAPSFDYLQTVVYYPPGGEAARTPARAAARRAVQPLPGGTDSDARCVVIVGPGRPGVLDAPRRAGSAAPRASALSSGGIGSLTGLRARRRAGSPRSGSASRQYCTRRDALGLGALGLGQTWSRYGCIISSQCSHGSSTRSSSASSTASSASSRLQDAPAAMQTRHHGADRDVEDLRRVGVAEVADVDEHDHVAEVVRHLGERGDDVVLREPLDDPLLVRARRRRRLRELVVEEVVALLQRLRRRGARCARRPRSMLRFVRMRSSQARRFVPGVYERQLRNARAYVSCIRSSASSREPTSCRATR